MTTYQGQPVVYRLNQGDVDSIKARRAQTGTGGNTPTVGDCCPAFVVKRWSPTYANLIVFLDGPDSYWATSRNYGFDLGQWSEHGPVAVPEPATESAQ